jgi:asparagine N-glycosylation enzyme membrane subunit Stt3
MVLATIAPIFVGYIIIKLVYLTKKCLDDKSSTSIKKPLVIGISIIVLFSSIFTGYTFYQTTTTQSYNFVPNYYNVQWQNAMSWVKDNTSPDSVFASWWDYGYWIQAIGERATVTDGGNVITYWNYLMGRHVLVGDNQKDALEFLYNHNVNYLLIDSSDIRKYGAYSSIGSDKDYDKFSVVHTLLLDPQQVQETTNTTTSFYKGDMGLDEDITYTINETIYFFPQSQSAIYGILVTTNKNNTIDEVNILIFNKGAITPLPLRYAQYNENYYDFGKGLNGTIKIISRVNNSGNLYSNGALIYSSPRVSKTLFTHLYLLDDPTNKFSNFKISHIEPNILTQTNDIFFYDPIGIVGPIKIWSVTYSGNEQLKEEYIDIDPDKYLDWKL